jgi:4-alpha-glucanotransferase
MEEYNEDAAQEAAGNGASGGNQSKQAVSGKKAAVKKVSKVAAAPAQVDKPQAASESAEKTIEKASPKKAVAAKAEIIEPKPARVKKAAAKASENKEQAATEPKSKIKKAAAVNKQQAAGKKTDEATKDIAVTNPVEEQQQITGEHTIVTLPQPQDEKQEVALPGADEQAVATDQSSAVSDDPDFTPAGAPDPVPAIELVNEDELRPLDNAEINEPSATSQQPEAAAMAAVAEGPVAEEQSAVAEAEGTASPSDASGSTVSTLQKIVFQVRYHTTPGQSLYVTGNHVLLGDNTIENAFPLNYLNDQYWIGTLEVPSNQPLSEDIFYNYILKNNDGTITREWGDDKVIQPLEHQTKELFLIDAWNSSFFVENTFYTEPFQRVLLKENFTEVESKAPENVTHIFKVKAPLLSKGQTLCITGSAVELGEWDTENPILLSKRPEDVWYKVEIDLSPTVLPIEYKYGVFDVNVNKFIRYEDGANRLLDDNVAPDKLTIVSDGFAILPFNTFKGAGLAIPVFSLRSERSFGVGEFTDLKLLVDWAKQAGLKLIQLLPVNDTTATHQYTDSYPYAAISAFALHPLYLHLPAIVNKDNQALLNSLQEKQSELNDKADVDYVGVMAAKWDLIKQVFPSQKHQTFNSPDFKAFFDENAHWLIPYAAFSYLREKYNTSDFNQWPTNKAFDAEQIKSIASSPLHDQDDVSMYYYVQYHLHLQLQDAANYAHANGIIVKGDIPIGIYRNSCDAWQEPQLFNMDMQAGAPPDDFAVKGQNWGFPTYNWQRMREDGFAWWKKRFKQMSFYFDAFRIDHILGFFRIWSIPMDSVEGIMGHFVPAAPVHINEFSDRGIAFDYDRFTKPFINDAVLTEIFGNDAGSVITEFLQPSFAGHYTLKAEFDTQRKVEAHFSSLENTAENKKIQSGLFDLISNVILFEAEGSGGQAFHFRISMDTIPSFRYLDPHTQYLLKELYVNYFYRRQDTLWMKEAMLKLPELKRSTNMLICGEDLGMVPASVPGVMKELAILSLEIQRMPKDPSQEFFHPNNAPYLSVVTPSTHDMSTIRGWWEEDRAATQRFFNNELGQWGTAPYFCEPWINRIILMQHLYSPAMWSIFQLQDLLGINGQLRRENPHEERINIPADPKHYWRYRMHLTLEQLSGENEFTSELRSYVVQSGR